MYEKGLGAKQSPIKAHAWLVVAGHYFIYEVATEIDKSAASASNNYVQLLLVQQKEKDKILDDI